MKYLLIVIAVLGIAACYSQEANKGFKPENFSFGMNLGVKSTYFGGGLSAEYLFPARLRLNLGVCTSKTAGIGADGGFTFNFTDGTFIPFAGINAAAVSGNNRLTATNGTQVAQYRSRQNYYVIPNFGIRYQEETVAVYVAVGYQYLTTPKEIEYVSGTADEELKNTFIRKYNGGWGIGFGIMLHLNGLGY